MKAMKNKALAVGEALVVMIEMVIVLAAALIVAIGAGAGMMIQRLKEKGLKWKN